MVANLSLPTVTKLKTYEEKVRMKKKTNENVKSKMSERLGD